MSSLRPTVGARFLLERVEGGRYRAAIYTADNEWEGVAILAEDGGSEVTIEAPAELVEQLEMQARLLARGAAKRREDGLAVWPARVMRWRGPGRGG